MVEQATVIIYPTKEEVTIEKRKDDGYNLHNESGVTTWNVPETEVERLIAYQKLREGMEQEELRNAARLLALEIDSSWDEAAKYNTLFDLRKNRASLKLQKAAAKDAGVPLFLAAGTDPDVSHLVSYLQHVGCKLYAHGKNEADVDRAFNEYLTWSGESLPEIVKIQEKAYGREWFLIFKFSADVSYPFPIIEMGTGGGEGTPTGLHRSDFVTVCYPQIIEQLVRAGLRA
jgi:hypothetical protein